MLYVGIDVGKRFHVVSAVGGSGEEVFRNHRVETSREGFEQLDRRIRRVGPRSEARIACEASGPYWLPLFEYLVGLRYDVVVANPIQVAAFRNQGIRGSKTDGIDSLLVAQVLRMGALSGGVPSTDRLLSLRVLTRHRAELGRTVGSMKRCILNIMDILFPEYHQAMPKTRMFTQSSLKILKTAPCPEDWEDLDLSQLEEEVHAISGLFRREKLMELRDLAQDSIGAKLARRGLTIQLRCLVEQLEFTLEQSKVLEGEIKAMYEELQDTLTTIPGVGMLNAALIRAEFGDLSRFEQRRSPPAAMVAYCGLDPKLSESGESRGKVRMSKRGSFYLRRALIQSAHVASQYDPMFRKIYQSQRERGKHHTVALSLVARKMVHVIYALLKSGRPYQPMMN